MVFEEHGRLVVEQMQGSLFYLDPFYTEKQQILVNVIFIEIPITSGFMKKAPYEYKFETTLF